MSFFKNFKKRAFVSLLTLALAFQLIPSITHVQAASNKIYNLKEGKTYSFNLDQSGETEKISFSLSNDVYKIKVNGKLNRSIKLDKLDFYSPKMQILDIDKNDGYLDIWVYAYAFSEDICYSGLYRYSSGKIKALYIPKYKKLNQYAEFGNGYITQTDGKGKFYICYDRAFFTDCLIGNHYDSIPYRLSNEKVSRINTNTYPIHKVFTTDGSYTLNKSVSFLKKPSTKANTSMTLKKGAKVYPVSTYCTNKSLFVKFKTKSGKTGWLNANNYSFEHMGPFTNIPMFD